MGKSENKKGYYAKGDIFELLMDNEAYSWLILTTHFLKSYKGKRLVRGEGYYCKQLDYNPLETYKMPKGRGVILTWDEELDRNIRNGDWKHIGNVNN